MSVIKKDNVIDGFMAGDYEIIKAFYKRHFPGVKSFILNNSGTDIDAEDIFQDALVLTYQKLHEKSLILTCSLATYIYATSRYLWMNRLKKRRKIVFTKDAINNSEVLSDDFIEYLVESDKQMIFQKYFLKLSDKCQQLLNYFFSEKKMRDIAISMDYSEGYTRKKKFECKKYLFEMIETDPIFKELRNEKHL